MWQRPNYPWERRTLEAAIAAIRDEKQERTALEHWSGMNRSIGVLEELRDSHGYCKLHSFTGSQADSETCEECQRLRREAGVVPPPAPWTLAQVEAEARRCDEHALFDYGDPRAVMLRAYAATFDSSAPSLPAVLAFLRARGYADAAEAVEAGERLIQAERR